MLRTGQAVWESVCQRSMEEKGMLAKGARGLQLKKDKGTYKSVLSNPISSDICPQRGCVSEHGHDLRGVPRVVRDVG